MLNPDQDGTFTSGGAMGGTELMLQGLHKHVDPALLSEVNIICSRVRSIDTKRKNILWLHDLWNDPEASHLRDARSLGRFTKLVFVSHWQQYSYNLGLGVPYSAGIVLQNAIEPLPPFEKTKGPYTPENPLRLIYHTTPHRGLELLVPVFEKLAEIHPYLHLDVFSSFNAYGWPERDKPYEELFARCRNHPQITYHGFQNNATVREALLRAHIFAYPSIWVETSCIAAIEAMSAGCTIVCPTLGALPETTANFSYLYPYHEDFQTHAETFAAVTDQIIRKYDSPAVATRRDIQKQYADAVYNWNLRGKMWTAFLKGMLSL